MQNGLRFLQKQRKGSYHCNLELSVKLSTLRKRLSTNPARAAIPHETPQKTAREGKPEALDMQLVVMGLCR